MDNLEALKSVRVSMEQQLAELKSLTSWMGISDDDKCAICGDSDCAGGVTCETGDGV